MKGLQRWACGLCVSVAAVFPMASFAGDEAAPKDCRLRQLASIDMKIGSIVLIPVVLDGRSAFMGLNTTLAISVLQQQAATEMKLPIGKAPRAVTNAPGLVSIQSLSLGSYNIGKVTLLVFPGDEITMPGLPVSIGSIALPTLIGMDYELDFAHNKFNLFSSTHCPGNVVYWADKAAAIPYTLDKLALPIFPIELDGKKVSAALQVGGSTTRLKTDVSKAVYGFDEHSIGIRHEASNSGKTVNHYRAMKMTLPGLSVANADVELVPGLAKSCNLSTNSGPEHSANYQTCFGNPPLTVGLDVLKHLRLYFATAEHIVYVTEADATREGTPTRQ